MTFRYIKRQCKNTTRASDTNKSMQKQEGTNQRARESDMLITAQNTIQTRNDGRTAHQTCKDRTHGQTQHITVVDSAKSSNRNKIGWNERVKEKEKGVWIGRRKTDEIKTTQQTKIKTCDGAMQRE